VNCARAKRSTAKNKVKTPSGVLSTAEAISLLANSMALSGNFGDGTVSDNDLASGLQGAISKTTTKTSWSGKIISAT